MHNDTINAHHQMPTIPSLWPYVYFGPKFHLSHRCSHLLTDIYDFDSYFLVNMLPPLAPPYVHLCSQAISWKPIYFLQPIPNQALISVFSSPRFIILIGMSHTFCFSMSHWWVRLHISCLWLFDSVWYPSFPFKFLQTAWLPSIITKYSIDKRSWGICTQQNTMCLSYNYFIYTYTYIIIYSLKKKLLVVVD